jgi:TerC family integral membrane protein
MLQSVLAASGSSDSDSFADIDVPPWAWGALLATIVAMLAVDLALHRGDKEPTPKRALAESGVWVACGLTFALVVAAAWGREASGEYLAGYLIEKSLSVDNVFVFALIFAAFAVPAAYQHRLLFWGILGAVVFRAAFIAAGTAVLEAAHWVIYLLGLLLVVTGIRLARSRGHAVDPEKNPVLRLFRRVVPMTDDYRGAAFIVIEAGRRLATPLLAALVAVETTDIMFALDSIPAVFAITTDPFIVFSSNLFAILGLRSLYFLLAGLLDRFVYLKIGLAALLVFAGAKILTSSIVEIPIAVSLGAIALILGTAIVASLIATHPERGRLERRFAWSVLRVSSGVLLGLGALAAFGLMAVLRDADAGWLVLDVAVLAAVVVVVLLGSVLLRRVRAQPAVARAWVTLGAATLLVLALFFSLD